MKKTILITCIALVLLSFVSCNLDNSGILLDGLKKVPSDNKNRSFIGFDKDSNIMYYVTVDGLVQRKIATDREKNEDKIDTPEVVISNHTIFTHYYQALGWLQDDNTIVYMTDKAGKDGGQDFYSIDTASAEVTSLKVEEEHTGIVDCYMASDGAKLVGDDGTIYSAEISGETIKLNVKSDSQGTFVSSTNGLIRYSNGSYYYDGEKTSGISGVVRSFATSDDGSTKYAVSVSGSSFLIFKADGGTAFSEINSIPGSNNNEFPSIIDSEGNLYFLYYRGTRSSSLVYKVFPSEETKPQQYDLQKNNIKAEAFVQGSDNKIYMLSKDNNMFVVTI